MKASPIFSSVKENIEHNLTVALAPSVLVVQDESHKHHGHSGARPEGETHFHIKICAKKLDGLSRIARERAVHAPLADLLRSRVHALSITVVPSQRGI